MVVECKICKGQFDLSPDSIVLCGFKDGVMHLGCCINNCSLDRQPCEHSLGTYDKLE